MADVTMADVIVYWRPMCGYCEVLKRELAHRGVTYTDVDIWADRAMARLVREATGGDEIVPTVQVGERLLVNPSVEEVVAAVRAA